jgi:hypothetical protein
LKDEIKKKIKFKERTQRKMSRKCHMRRWVMNSPPFLVYVNNIEYSFLGFLLTWSHFFLSLINIIFLLFFTIIFLTQTSLFVTNFYSLGLLFSLPMFSLLSTSQHVVVLWWINFFQEQTFNWHRILDLAIHIVFIFGIFSFISLISDPFYWNT